MKKALTLLVVTALLASCGPPPLRQVDTSAGYLPINTPGQAQELIHKHAR